LFGDDVSYIYMGECIGFRNHHAAWSKWERAYADLVFRTISVDNFISAGGYGEDIRHLIGVRREPGEAPVLHAEIYGRVFLGKADSLSTLDHADDKCFGGSYVLPSTERNEMETSEGTGRVGGPTV
jgi:hypothetical protein